MKAKKEGLWERIRRKSELPLSYVGRCAELYLVGERELIVDGCRCVLTYEDEVIELVCGDRLYRITGEGFDLRSYYDGKMKIIGRIDGIVIQKEGGRGV